MNSSTKAELQMLRELVWFAYGAQFNSAEVNVLNSMLFCYFCGRPLLHQPPNITFGHRHHPPVVAEITLHHADENRENNTPSNLKPCHNSCHRSHHAKKRALISKTRKEVITQRYANRQEEIDKEKETHDAEVLIPRGRV